MKTKQTRWYYDIQKIIRGLTIFILIIVTKILKGEETFLKFQSQQPSLNDSLHDYIFRNLLVSVNYYTAKATFILVIIAILVLILAYVFDHYHSDMGYKLHIAGMTTTSLTGILYLLVHICVGYGKPVIGVTAYIFFILLVLSIIITIHNYFFFLKRKHEFQKEDIAVTITIFSIIAVFFVGYGSYLVKNLHTDYKVCHEHATYLKEHPRDINEDAAYQIGNIVKLNSIYYDGYMYYANDKNLYQIDSKGNVDIVYSLPGEAVFYATNIYHYDGYLYMACWYFNESKRFSIIQLSLADKTVKEIYSRDGNNLYFSVVDGKLLYELQTEYRSNVYCLDLNKSYDIADATLYDKDINSLYLDRSTWIQKYSYTFLGAYYNHLDGRQYIDGKVYYTYDCIAAEQGYDYKAPDKYSYNANCTLIILDENLDLNCIVEGVVDFNIFNKTIYYASETETGYDIFSCDENGNNISYITSIPVDFIYDKHAGYYTNIIMGDGFMICTISAPHDDSHRYFIDIDSGDIKEISFN